MGRHGVNSRQPAGTLNPAAYQRPHPAKPQHEAVNRFCNASEYKYECAGRVKNPGAEQGNGAPSGCPQNSLPQGEQTLCHWVARIDCVQVPGGTLETALADFAPVGSEVNEIVEGVHGCV